MLQIEQVFTNVPKGQVAKKDDWSKAFNTEDMNKVIEEVCLFAAYRANFRFSARASSK